MYNTIITSIVIFVVTTTSLYAEVWFGIDPAWSSTYQIGRISLSGDILTPINLGQGNAPTALAVVGNEVWYGITPKWANLNTYQIGRVGFSGNTLSPINLGRGNAPTSLAVVGNEVWYGIDPAWSSTYQIGRISLSGDILTPINLGRGNAPISLAVVPEPMMLFLLGLGGLAIRHGRGPKHE